jgi:hypothetical protein
VGGNYFDLSNSEHFSFEQGGTSWLSLAAEGRATISAAQSLNSQAAGRKE